MMRPPPYFEEIRQRAAQRWDQLEADAELAAPWHQLFKQVQSPRHVVSELLQNADDAGATRASVLVDGNEFIFSHNGEDFQQQHFASLCRFGYSNKRALHTIGFRAIGFKSTFSLGDEVRLQTPTLSVSFRKARFTEPFWLDGQVPENGETVLRAKFQDELRKTEIEKNLSHWIQSPASLLFFRSLRNLRIGDDEVIWQSTGAGPVPDSEWVNLSSENADPVLLIRSELEDFPENAIEEIRQERMLGDAEEASLPPCKVEIVLGLEGRLFVVLPTGVRMPLPFACNAPFVQDPARVKIKDPETSPTNRWLLERVGRLAAQAMLCWLRRDDLTISERAMAYGLLPELSDSDDSIEGTCAAIIAAAFDETIRGESFLLTDTGQLTGVQQCVLVPPWLTEVWDREQVVALFDSKHRALFAREVGASFRDGLVRRGHLDEITIQQVLEVLKEKHLPRPKSWRSLLTLWDAVAPSVTQFTYGWQPSWKTVRIVPVQGQDCLYAAPEVVRLGEKRLLHSDEDWEFLSRFLLVMNPNWGRYLADQKRAADSEEDADLARQLVAANGVMQAIGLGDSSDASRVMDKVALGFFEQEEVTIRDCVRLAHIAAALEAKVSPQFEFVTQNGTRTSRSQTTPLIADARFDLDSMANEKWCSEHTLHSAYWDEFSSCTADEWAAWLNSGQSGLLGFIPLESKSKHIYRRSELQLALQKRGFDGEPSYPYVTSDFVIEDWDFADEHWRHWEVLARGDKAFWGKLLARIFEQPASYWNQCLTAQVLQVSTSKSRRILDVKNLLPAWILKLRSKACLQDTWGQYREPAELLRRTPETESLLDVEPFVRADLDNEAVRPLLIRLGVRDTPAGPRRLLERLQALSTVTNPPVYEVQKWCHRIDAMLPKCSTEEFQEVKDAFHSQKLILTSNGEWTRAGEVFLNSDEQHIPGAAVVHDALQQITLWQKIDVADRPTVEAILEWLNSLPNNERPSPDELRRIKEILPKHPHPIWSECRSWLNLEGEWVPADELRYSMSMQSLSSWGHLFPIIKRQVADFTRLPADVVHQPPFSELPSLASRLEERVQRNLMPMEPAQSKPWIAALGRGLSRIVTDSQDKTERIRTEGARLARTMWQTTALLETVPYLDGTPAGTARSNEVVWESRTLFVQDRPLAKMLRHLARELARPFDDSEVEDAIKFCVERSPDQVTEYLEQNFTLAPAEDFSTEPEPTDGLQVDQTEDAYGGDLESPEFPSADSPDLPDAEAPFSDDDSVTESDDGGPEGGADEPEPSSVPRRTTARPKQLSLIERYAQLNGFKRESEQDRFYHADGRWLQKEHGMTFPWEMYSASGDMLRYFWVKEHCLDSEPLQIGADVWEACRRAPQSHSLLLTSGDGSPLEISGQHLVEMVNQGDLVLHPATYRLVSQRDEALAQEPA